MEANTTTQQTEVQQTDQEIEQIAEYEMSKSEWERLQEIDTIFNTRVYNSEGWIEI